MVVSQKRVSIIVSCIWESILSIVLFDLAYTGHQMNTSHVSFLESRKPCALVEAGV